MPAVWFLSVLLPMPARNAVLVWSVPKRLFPLPDKITQEVPELSVIDQQHIMYLYQCYLPVTITTSTSDFISEVHSDRTLPSLWLNQDQTSRKASDPQCKRLTPIYQPAAYITLCESDFHDSARLSQESFTCATRPTANVTTHSTVTLIQMQCNEIPALRGIFLWKGAHNRGGFFSILYSLSIRMRWEFSTQAAQKTPGAL